MISLDHDTVKYNLLETNGIEDEIELIQLKQSKGWVNRFWTFPNVANYIKYENPDRENRRYYHGYQTIEVEYAEDLK